MTSFDLNAVEAGLAGTLFAGSLLHFPSVTSTNVLALEAAQKGVRGGVWIADEQTAGQGRGGHGWHSSVGDGLYVSVLVAPALSMDYAVWLTLATGLAAQAAIREVSGLEADIRWPNDLLLDGRKCGGILVESAALPMETGRRAMLRYAVIGVGINVRHKSFPAELDAVATSIHVAGGVGVTRERLLVGLLRGLEDEIGRLTREYGGTLKETGLLERFALASSWVRGKRVRVEEGGGYTGVTDGLDSRGFLRVSGDDGIRHTVLSGGVRAV